MTGAEIPEPLRRQIQAELQPGEYVRWSGQPLGRALSSGMAWMFLPFGLVWTGFAVFWTLMAAGLEWPFQHHAGPSGFRLVFACLGIPFILIGLWLSSLPFRLNKKLRALVAQTAYVITNRRAIIFDAGYCRLGAAGVLVPALSRHLGRSTQGALEVRSFQPEQLNQLSRLQRPDGSGDIIFEEIPRPVTDGDGHQGWASRPVGFLDVANVVEVEQLLRELASPAPPPLGRSRA